MGVRRCLAGYPLRLAFGVISLYTTAGLVVLMLVFGRYGALASLPARVWVLLVVSGGVTVLVTGKVQAVVESVALLGFLAGKSDPTVDGGGPDRFIPVAQLEPLLKQAQRKPSGYYGTFGRRARRSAEPKQVQGTVFTVYATWGEMVTK